MICASPWGIWSRRAPPGANRLSISRRPSPPREAIRINWRPGPCYGFPVSASYYEAGFDATWELDLFGRVRRNVEARNGAVTRSRSQSPRCAGIGHCRGRPDLLRARGQQTQLDVAGAQRRQPDRYVKAHAGARASRAWHRAGHLKGAVTAEHDSLDHRSAPGCRSTVDSPSRRADGRDPNALTTLLTPCARSAELPQIAAVGDPASLLRRRPDIRVAERQLAASTALRRSGHWRLFSESHLYRQLYILPQRSLVISAPRPHVGI